MAPEFDTLTVENCVQRITRTMRTAKAGVPFTIIVGAGVSMPLIPSAWKMVEDIPKWLRQHEATKQPLREYRKQFWADAAEHDASLVLTASGLPDQSIPANIGTAYQAAMRHGIGSPALRRDYIMHLITKAGDVTNIAHLFLASIFAAQDGSEWGLGVPFCRTLFTTNFDPLMQRALQMMGMLYYISDRPASLDSALEFPRQGVHLVYSHGSLFSYRLANTDSEIRRVVAEQDRSLVSFFEQHGVVVIGYSGWSDVCMDALLRCGEFRHNLYWCDIHRPDMASSCLRPEAFSLLRKHRGNAFYVPIYGADTLLQALHISLGLGEAPELVSSPLSAAARRLNSVKTGALGLGNTIQEFEQTLSQAQRALTLTAQLISAPDTSESEWHEVLRENHIVAAIQHAENDRLEAAEALLARLLDDAGSPDTSRFRLLHLRAQIRFDYGDQDGTLSDLNAALAIVDVPETEWAYAVFLRSELHEEMNDVSAAIDDVSLVVERATEAECVCGALHRRAVLLVDSGNDQAAVADLDRLIDVPDAPPDILATAFGERALAKQRLGNMSSAMDDYDALFQIDELEPAFAAEAHLFRGQHFEQRGLYKEAIDDYTTVIESPDAVRQHAITAFQYRAVCREEIGDEHGAQNDYLKAANARHDAEVKGFESLLHRATCHLLAGDREKAIEDYSLAIDGAENRRDPDVLDCVLQRGNILCAMGHVSEAIADFSTVINSHDAARPESLSLAYALRGGLFVIEGRSAAAAADLLQAEDIALPESELWWNARIQRAWVVARTDDVKEAVELLDESLVQNPPARNRFRVQQSRAELLLLEGDADAALDACLDAESRVEHSDAEDVASFYVTYAKVCMLLGEYQDALTNIRKGMECTISDDDENAELQFVRTKVLVHLGRASEAIRRGDIEGDNAEEAAILQAELLVNVGRHDLALEKCELLASHTDAGIRRRVVLAQGEALLRLGKCEDAFEKFQTCNSEYPDDPVCRFYLAICAAKQGEMGEATQQLKCALQVVEDRDIVEQLASELIEFLEGDTLGLMTEIVKSRVAELA